MSETRPVDTKMHDAFRGVVAELADLSEEQLDHLAGLCELVIGALFRPEGDLSEAASQAHLEEERPSGEAVTDSEEVYELLEASVPSPYSLPEVPTSPAPEAMAESPEPLGH